MYSCDRVSCNQFGELEEVFTVDSLFSRYDIVRVDMFGAYGNNMHLMTTRGPPLAAGTL